MLAVPIGTEAIQDWPDPVAWAGPTAAPMDKVERTRAPARAVATCAKRSVVNMVGLRNLASPPAHPAVISNLKHGPCHRGKMAEILEIRVH